MGSRAMLVDSRWVRRCGHHKHSRRLNCKRRPARHLALSRRARNNSATDHAWNGQPVARWGGSPSAVSDTEPSPHSPRCASSPSRTPFTSDPVLRAASIKGVRLSLLSQFGRARIGLPAMIQPHESAKWWGAHDRVGRWPPARPATSPPLRAMVSIAEAVSVSPAIPASGTSPTPPAAPSRATVGA